MKEQRVNYVRQINGFWYKASKDKRELKAHHISLYLFLLNQNNLKNWEKWFQCPYKTLMAGARIRHHSTYYQALKDLQKCGYIKYKKGQGTNQMAKFHLPLLYESQDTAPPSKIAGVEETPPSKIAGDPRQKRTQTPVKNEHIIKLNDKTLYKTVPAFSEFKDFALKNKPNVDLQHLKFKYDYWDRREWVNGAGKKITDWQETLLNTLPYLKENGQLGGRREKCELRPDYGMPSETSMTYAQFKAQKQKENGTS
jgi:hypothetical protein